jgi:hypothetical protein
MAVNDGLARRVKRVTQICAQTLALAMPPVDDIGAGAAWAPNGTLEHSGDGS